ncbi:MAG: PRC and DUF2382 domain-containing protein [Thermoleophilaceae bacterium]|nr:PRC and DUF2382 domain-containing protein [Thermoleophilaceae bacterium]
MPDVNEVQGWRDRTVIDADGDKVGKLEEIYMDEDTGKPEWGLVNTGLFGSKSSFVPIEGATSSGDDVQIRHSKDLVKDAPGIEADGQLTQDEEAKLYSHYGLEYGENRSGSGLPEGDADHADVDHDGVGHDTSGPTTDDAMTRSEEELSVGKTEREAGRARLRKYVVTEEVQQTVPVQREEVRLEREPITDANVDSATDGPAISDEEHKVVLHEEEVVTEKRAVPKERVRLDKETVTEEQTVSEEVRKEQIETEGDVGR